MGGCDQHEALPTVYRRLGSIIQRSVLDTVIDKTEFKSESSCGFQNQLVYDVDMSRHLVSRKALMIAYRVWRFILRMLFRVEPIWRNVPVIVELIFNGKTVKLLHPAKTPEDLWRAKRLGGREPEVESFFRPERGWTVLDAGANIGYYTVKASKMVGKRGRVVSVEPYHENHELLLQNLELNSCSNVQVVKKALTDYNGSTRLYLGTDSGHNTLLGGSVFATGEWENVDAVTLDTLLRELGIESIDLAKIDVEGEELNLLEGARESLTEGRIHRLVVEVHSRSTEDNPVHRYLRDVGYDVSVIKRRFPSLRATRHHIYATLPSDRLS